MFEVAELGRKLSKEQYDKEEARLRPALLAAQARLREASFPCIVVVGGVDGAGKGETVNLLLEWMDPRGIEVHAVGEPTQDERERPPYWRYWLSLPPRGRIGVFHGSWYTDVIVQRVLGKLKKSKLSQGVDDILTFERLMADDGALLVKYWFHLSKPAQERRLRSLERDKRTRWRVTKEDWRRFKRYDEFREVSANVLQDTSVGHAPWTIIEGEDERYRGVAAARTLLEALEERLDAEPRRKRKLSSRAAAPTVRKGEITILDRVAEPKPIARKAYDRKLEELQGRLFRLAREAALARVSTVVVYEGWDAAGKGGNIRRLTQGMDARNYRVIPIAAPTEEERAHPYLWRFWRALPRRGRVTIFDRSWYGRVLVERVEGFCSEEEWRRAYGEINELEEQLSRQGTIVVKFWLHVSKQEQLRRFRERARLAYKRFKLGPDDWRNRSRWSAYLAAVDEMVERTSTPHAPWTIVNGTDKLRARLATLATLCRRLEDAL